MAQASASQVERKFMRKAIFVGVGSMGVSDLKKVNVGAATDVHSLSETVKKLYKLEKEDMLFMSDSIHNKRDRLYPLANNVLDAVQFMFRAIWRKQAVGEVLLYLSCHGDRKPESVLENNSCFKEIVWMADQTYLTDHDFRELSKGAPPGVNFSLATDSCHSGALIEGAREQIGSSTDRVTLKPGTFPYEKLNQRLDGHEVGLLLSAAQSFESAFQAVPDTEFIPSMGVGGVFTYCMNVALIQSEGDLTPRQLIENVNKHMCTIHVLEDPYGQKGNFVVGQFQHAGLYGSDAQCNGLFFGGPVKDPPPPPGSADAAWND